jgi:hypothetical protein
MIERIVDFSVPRVSPTVAWIFLSHAVSAGFEEGLQKRGARLTDFTSNKLSISVYRSQDLEF